MEIQKDILFINDTDAGSKGICMGDKFLDTLRQPCALKDYVTNESRLAHGKAVVVRNARKAARSITLTFFIHGATSTEYYTAKAWLYEQLAKGYVKLRLNKSKVGGVDEYYHLVYTGKSLSYGEGVEHCDGKVTCGFDEPNPDERGDKTTSIVYDKPKETAQATEQVNEEETQS